MKEFIVIDRTGIVTFLRATSAQQALMIATDMGYKPFTIQEV